MKTLYKILILLLICPLLGTGQNNGLRFDGTEESVTISNKAAINISDTYTIEAWIFADNWSSQSWQGSIFANDLGTPLTGFAFRCGDNGKLSFVMSVDNRWNEIISPSLMNTKQWHHTAAVVDNGTMSLYIDGLQVASGSYSGTVTPSDGNFTIGESTGFSGRVFNGVLDEIRIWNTARTASQIADNKTTNFTGTEDGLVAYFPMNDESGNTVTNLVDAACNGLTVNMDDSNWVDGYTLPDFDVSVKNISNIDRVHMKTRPVKLTVDIQNVGTEAIENVTASIMLNGSMITSEVAATPIMPGESITYSFATPIDLRDLDNPNLAVQISHPDDANSLNNDTEIDIVTRQGSLVNIFDNSQHNFGAQGQRQSNTVILPGDLSHYEQLLLHISVDCPSGGCDPWDQTGNVMATNTEGEFEIARYITPYGIACGPWTVDVTDFKSQLTGEVLYNSFIQVFGQSGWLVNIDLELIEGTDGMPYKKLTPIYQTDYHVYGDPGIDDDLAAIGITVDDNTEASHIRMHVTGHGQGNTNNAAEFYQVTHQIMLDGNPLADHDLWKSDCSSNSCANQAGNWLFPRAGWCPGQEVIPAIFNTTGSAQAGQTIELDYELQDYTNLLNTGYNNSGHTEPHYRIHGVFVESSSTPFEEYNNLAVSEIDLTDERIVATILNDGNVNASEYVVDLYKDGILTDTKTISTALNSGMNSTVEFDVDIQTVLNSFFVVEVISSGDQSPGDNLLGKAFDVMISTNDPIVGEAFTVIPNPSSGNIELQMEASLMNGNWFLHNLEGQLIDSRLIDKNSVIINVENAGMYILRLVDTEGRSSSKKVIIID